MGIQTIKLSCVRVHENSEFSFNPNLTIIFGKNGSGKTTVLEAINLISIGKSFKTHRQKELINNKFDNLVVVGSFSENDQKKDKIAVSVSKYDGQKIKLNGKTINNRKDIIGRNPVVVLSPEEQKITTGPPLSRRQFFDRIFSTVSSEYIFLLQKYNKTLKQRNASLLLQNKKEQEAWIESLSDCAVKLWFHRQKKIETFSHVFYNISEMFDNKINVKINYLKVTPTKEKYKEVLFQNLKKDIEKKTTSTGPHRDNINFTWFKKNTRTHCSQGENKIYLVLLKLSELLFLINETNKKPIFMMDDLFATLDIEKSKRTVEVLGELTKKTQKNFQTIITTTDIINLEESGFLTKNIKHKTHHLRN